ncbi:NAD(P)/FAD-dependent oxidoreductase [Salinicoccus carnicancri]|uniref:NAD(P)/FAD-dependent oxidoreductase n=1 Tax=Salinicoccus carnicancri TaxID=558170 RepID=UPI00031A887A|nr:FAD-dependent oxidoreductase [Salinicoccus carnicancri]
MTNVNATTLIVGSGIAGIHAAETLRAKGYGGRIVLADRDSSLPYDRPPLSKEFMLGEVSEDEIALKTEEYLQELGIELWLGEEVVSVDSKKQSAVLSNGKTLEWDKLLLATGSGLRKLPVKGSELNGIYYLKTLADANAIKEKLKNIEQVAVVGAGFIGAELASTFKKLGKEVTIIEWSPLPLAHILGDEMGEYFLKLHQSEGIRTIMGDSVTEFKGDGEVEEIVTGQGKSIPCQAVIIGVGVMPNTQILNEELDIERGYIVNEFGETSLPNIYAAGDCSMWPFLGKHISIEHWDHAMNHGQNVATNILEENSTPYEAVPYFWSDQYEKRLQYFGNSKNWNRTLIRGDKDEGEFSYFYLDENNVIEAALLVNQPRNAISVRRLIKQQKPVDLNLLSDSNVKLKKCVADA